MDRRSRLGAGMATIIAGVAVIVTAQTIERRAGSFTQRATMLPSHRHESPTLAVDAKALVSHARRDLQSGAGLIPPPAPPIWGVLAPDILGTCPLHVHERYVLDGEDGLRYRTWHPQTVPMDRALPNGPSCTFAHEHGDDPSTQTLGEVRNVPIRFGYVGRRMPMPTEPNGHEEPHEGFKVYVANAGQRNGEGRINLHDSRIVLHMGTGGARRFTTQHHSLQYVVRTNAGAWLNIQTMADTGGVANICANPRQPKTVMVVDPACKVDSLYEIWEATAEIRNTAGVLVARAVVSTAAFDPITAFDPTNPTRLVYIWDPAVDAILRLPDGTKGPRAGARGCDREAYHGPTLWDNDTGQDVYFSDALGREVANGPLRQEVSRFRLVGPFVATNDGLSQFKVSSMQCRQGLGVKN